MVIAAHDQISAQTQPQPHDPLRLGRGRSRALEIRRRHLFTRPRRHRTGPFVWPRFPAGTTAGASDATPTDDHDIRDGEAPPRACLDVEHPRLARAILACAPGLAPAARPTNRLAGPE